MTRMCKEMEMVMRMKRDERDEAGHLNDLCPSAVTRTRTSYGTRTKCLRTAYNSLSLSRFSLPFAKVSL